MIMAPKNKGYDIRISLRLSSDLKNKCETIAREEGFSLNEWINNTLIEKVTITDTLEERIKKLEDIFKALSASLLNGKSVTKPIDEFVVNQFLDTIGDKIRNGETLTPKEQEIFDSIKQALTPSPNPW